MKLSLEIAFRLYFRMNGMGDTEAVVRSQFDAFAESTRKQWLDLATYAYEAALAQQVADQTNDDPEFAAAFAQGDAEIRAGLGKPLAQQAQPEPAVYDHCEDCGRPWKRNHTCCS